jgi:hypothetical protein
MLVIGMLEATILLNGRRISEMDPIALLHQGIHNPIPVIGRFHHNPDHLLLIRLEALSDPLKIIGKPPPKYPLSILIDDP